MNRPRASAPPPPGGDPSAIRISTEDFPAQDRLEAWRELVGRGMLRFEIERLPDRRYACDTTMRALPGLCMIDGAVTGMQFHRTPALIDNDDLVLHVSLSGGFCAYQGGREAALGRGEATLMGGAETFLASLPAERFFAIRVPSSVLSPMVGDLNKILMRPIPTDSDALRLLVTYARGIFQMPALANPDLRQPVATHLQDLVALALGATRDAAEVANGRGLRAARLKAIKADIAEHIGDTNLSIGGIAVRQRVTPRYIQMLFEAEGATFSEFVLNKRLQLAHRMLTDPRFADRPIISVALDSGFQDLSYFNRTFRRRFGETPSGVRANERPAQ
jgi:AraC-like DNA-binding protein